MIQEVYPNQRKSEESEYGVWHAFYDGNLICYAGILKFLLNLYVVLTDRSYSSGLAFQMLNEIIEEIYDKFPDIKSDSDNSDISLAGAKIFLVDIYKKYNNVQNFDKFIQAQDKVEQVAVEIKKSVDQMLEQEKRVIVNHYFFKNVIVYFVVRILRRILKMLCLVPRFLIKIQLNLQI